MITRQEQKLPPKADPPMAEKYIYKMMRKIIATVSTWRKNLKFKNNFSSLPLTPSLSKVGRIWKKSIHIKNIFQTFRSRRFGAIAVLIIFLAANVFQNTLTTQGAQYTFLQTDWSGGETANTAVHPTNSSGWDEFASATNLTTTTAGQATLAETTHENFSETFTADTYKDAVNTTADWNTSSGQVQMPGESSGVDLYEKLNGFLAGSTINAQVKDGDDYYAGSSTGKFLKYSSATDTATDLTAKISGAPVSWSTSVIDSLALDATNHVIYLGGASGKFARYNTAAYTAGGTYGDADMAYSLTSKISSFWGSNEVYGIVLDSADNVVYLGGQNSRFARYNTTFNDGLDATYPTADTAHNLLAKISSFWGSSDTIYTVSLVGDELYLSGSSSFAKYDISADAATDLTGVMADAVGTGGSVATSFLANGKVYGMGSTGEFFVFDITSGTATDLTSKISSFWGTNTPYAVLYDSANEVVYLGGSGGKFARYNTAAYTAGGTYGDADTAYDLNSKISSFWSTDFVMSFSLDSANDVLYLGGTTSKFARYNTTFNDGLDATYPTADTAYSLVAKISSFWSTAQINSLVLDAANNVIYLGGSSGKFARYNTTSNDGLDATYPTTDTAHNLTAKISSFWSTSAIFSLSFDSANKVMYLGGQSGKFARYNTTSNDGLDATYPTADTAHDLSAKITAASWSTNIVYSLSFDSANKVFYLGGANGKFARYNTTSWSGSGTCAATGGAYAADTACSLVAKISSWMSTGTVNTLSFDATNSEVHIGGIRGVGKYSIGSDSSSSLVSAYNAQNVFPFNGTFYTAAPDSANNVLYFAGFQGKFVRYNTSAYTAGGTYADANKAYDLTSKISPTFSTSSVQALAFDSANDALYLGGASGKFARYNTTFNDGSDATYPTADTAYSLVAKISSFWSTAQINSLVLDAANNVIYLGGSSGKFARYNTTTYVAGGTYPTADTAYYLASKVNGVDWIARDMNAALAVNANEIYVGSAFGNFAKYDSETGIATDLTDRISGAPVSWSTSAINALAYDSANKVVYLAGAGGKLARYNTSSWNGSGTCADTSSAYAADTACELTAKISGAPVSWSTSEIRTLAFDAANNVLYLGGASGKLARYQTSSWSGSGTCADTGSAYAADAACELTAKISSFWSTNTVYGLTLDSASNVLYLGGQNSKFARYNTSSNDGLDAIYPTADTGHDLISKISSFWGGTATIYTLSMDSSNDAVYLGGASAEFARYNTTANDGSNATYPAADTAYDLNSKISSFWSTNVIYSLLFDSVNGAVYLAGQSGKFGRYSISLDTAINLRSPETLSFWSTNIIYTVTADNDNQLYIGGASGYFAEKPPIPPITYAVSSTLDAQSYNIAYATLTKSDTVGTGTISYQLSNDGGSTWEDVTPAVNHVFTSDGSDLRFKIAVSGNATVQSIAIEYWAYNPTGELVSSKYNATDATNVLAKMAWTETLPAGTDLKFQIRTASSAVGLDTASWCGPDDGVADSCSSATYFTDPTGNETIDDLNNDLTDDQWFQYKIFFSTTDGVNTPTLSDATVTYVVNAPPELQNVTASQGADGLVTVDYDVRDPDTTTGVTQGVVNVGLQYCTANCSNSGSETWTDAVTLTGDYGAGLAVQEVNWTSYQLVWDPNTDYAGNYNATDFKIRVKAYDGELANHTGYGSSAVFTLDTSDPTLAADTLLINDSSAAVTPESGTLTLKLQNITGDTATETVYAQFSSDGSTWYGANGNNTLAAAGQWGTGFALDNIATLSWTWTMAARSETITVRIKDGYGNLQSSTDTNSSQYNAYPELQSVTASQGADGLVTVGFEAKDTDTAIGATPNALNITLQYCTASCSSPGNETWTDAVTATGDGSGVSVTGTGWTAHEVVWTAKTDYADQYNVTDFKVRLKADDGETVNNLDYLESSAFDLDTTDPTIGSFTFDHSNDLITIPQPSDEGNYELYVGASLATLFNVGNKTSPLLNQDSTYPNAYTYVSATDDPAPVYVGVKDAKGNTAYSQVMTPSRPTNLVYYDITNVSNNEYREFLAWSVIAEPSAGFASYKVYRATSENGTYELVDPTAAVITDRATNYFLDKIKDDDPLTDDSDPAFDPQNPTTYYYKVTSTDTDGNVSDFSSIINDMPNGLGGEDSTPPTITAVQVSNIDTTSAVVTWTTDELSDSLVGYSTDYSYTPQRGFSTFDTSHQVTLTNLSPNTTYHFNVQSEDALGNTGTVCYGGAGCSPGSNTPEVFTFTTDPGPAISSVSVSSNNTQATVSWVTTVDSDTYVVYSDTVTNGSLVNPLEVGTPDLVGGNSIFNHSQLLTTYNDLPLVPGTTYYFYVKSTDATSQTAIDNNGGNFYSFSTTQDDDAPVISGINAAIINNNKAAINWTTDEAATSIVNYGTVQGGPYAGTSEVLTFDKSHYVIINPLLPNTTYYYTVTSADINTNEDTSAEYSFTSLMDPAQQHDPLAGMTATIDSVEYDLTDADSAAVFVPAVLTDTSAVIEFTTDQIAMCVIEYRADGQEYNPTDFSIEETGYNVNHSMHIMSLVLDSLYYYRIECVDNLPDGQAGTVNSTEFSFTTLEEQFGASDLGDMIDSVAPTISGISAEVISGESVTVSWTTDEDASSYVNYGIASGTYTDMAGDPLINNDKTLYDTAHTVTVNGLIPGIEYYFTVISHDASGNIAESSQSNFTTENSSSLSSINITSAALGEAVITWSTSKEISSIVEYGLTDVYGQKKEDTAAVTEHSMTINGLESAKTYHLRVKGEDASGQLFSSGDYTFVPKSPPQIGTVVVKDITEHEATVSFATDFPTDFNITYASVGGESDSGSKGKPDFAINHEITLDKLKPGTTYSLKIRASDEQGNSVEKAAESFTTGKDEKAPEITKARTESALAQSDKVQTIISWETNELSECSLIYREGAGGEDKEYKVSDRAASNHVAVVTTFKPGTVYYFKIKSVDEAGNASVSSEYALLTPQKKENIVQIIVNNFQDIFSWVDKV